MRTCRAFGISTVAVYSDPDARSPHVRMADEAVRIGPAPSKESYLNFERIIEAAVRTGAQAIHPGYGFLSENADFAKACEDAGLIFIGPAPETIRKMGSKTAARQIMAAAGVPIVPGYDGDDQSVELLHDHAVKIGMPVLIKASAGGGGKGMRVVRDPSDLQAAIEAARRQSEKAFADGTLLIEKYIDNARHVEIQILGDHNGNLIHLYERECSIQRRHQKIIEESPSPIVNSLLRSRMCEAALAAGRAIGYTNAGTVEFILAPSGEFYFIEVNTRLQVEHPVTEMITGLDLVKLQIEIAEGKPLVISQEDVAPTGHAIEARLYAEEPRRHFLPAAGTMLEWEPPGSIDGVRIDSGIEPGSSVAIHYDPLLAKLVAHDTDRPGALRRLAHALRNLVTLGVATNRELLLRVIEHAEFQNGSYDTGFIDAHLSELTARADARQTKFLAGVAAIYLQKQRQSEIPISVAPNYRNNPFRDPSIKLLVEDEDIEVSWRSRGSETYEVSCGDWQATLELVSFEPGRFRVTVDGIQHAFRVSETNDQVFVQSQASSATITRLPRYPRSPGASEHESAFAPMPGQVLKILVEVGQQVSPGDPLVILEAMKMEQTLRAAAGGVVEAVLVKQGDVVAPGDALIEIAALISDE